MLVIVKTEPFVPVYREIPTIGHPTLGRLDARHTRTRESGVAHARFTLRNPIRAKNTPDFRRNPGLFGTYRVAGAGIEPATPRFSWPRLNGLTEPQTVPDPS